MRVNQSRKMMSPSTSKKSAQQERESTVVAGLVLIMLVLWLGFLIHRSPRFPGSGIGHAIGIVGACLMLVPLAYFIVKRVPALRRAVTDHVPMRTLLAWHIYAGIFGPTLVLLHSGHRFESPLGIALTGLTIVVVLSGYVGRYLMRHISTEIREKKSQLEQVTTLYDELRSEVETVSSASGPLMAEASLWRRLQNALFVRDTRMDPVLAALVPRALRLVESKADLEYAIGTHERFKLWFSKWLRWHIVLSFTLYGLLGLHVWATIYFGLRWLS